MVIPGASPLAEIGKGARQNVGRNAVDVAAVERVLVRELMVDPIGGRVPTEEVACPRPKEAVVIGLRIRSTLVGPGEVTILDLKGGLVEAAGRYDVAGERLPGKGVNQGQGFGLSQQ